MAVKQLILETFGDGLHLALIICDGEKASMACSADPATTLAMIDAGTEQIRSLPPEVRAQIAAGLEAAKKLKESDPTTH